MELYKTKNGGKFIVYVDAEIEDLVPGFLENRHKELGMLQEALAKDDYETIRLLGHAIKGVGGGYGFDVITKTGAFLEDAASEKKAGEIRMAIRNLLYYLENVEVLYE